MDPSELRIIFMGTPQFAVPSLDILVQHGFNIVGVITSTDKYGGRGKKKLLESAIKRYAVAHDLRILQPPRLKRASFLEELRSLQADLQVVVAFRMLPELVWNMPRLGTINLHGSLLPQYRGAAPINWAVMNGDKESGLTTFQLRHEIDTGRLIYQSRLPIGEDETAGELHDRMAPLGAQIVLKTVNDMVSGSTPSIIQNESLVSHAPKLYHETCAIDFHQPVRSVHNFIRGLSPHPLAWTTIDGLQLNIIRSEVCLTQEITQENFPGKLDLSAKGQLKITCNDGYIRILEAQLQGRKRMLIKDLLNGFSPQSLTVNEAF